jgi:hypothetical protein
MKLRFCLVVAGLTALFIGAEAQTPPSVNYKANDRFEQMGQILPTPNTFRRAEIHLVATGAELLRKRINRWYYENRQRQ